MTYAIILIVLAGIAEHFKDLSEEGKLKGYWDKNHRPQFFWDIQPSLWTDAEGTVQHELWWKVHWLQGPKWDWIPVWIRQYLSFRDGWHLLKFFSLTFGTAGLIWLGTEWIHVVSWMLTQDWVRDIIGVFPGKAMKYLVLYFPAWFIARCAFSLPETILRQIESK